MDAVKITSAKYAGHESIGIYIDAVVDGREMSVPLDPANRHYAEIMRQVEAGELVIQETEGNEPLPADPVE